MRLIVLASIFLVLVASTAFAVVPSQDEPGVVLRALDKMNARVGEIKASINQPFKFGTLTITARACRDTPPEDKPEAAAFLDISEATADGTEQSVFHGWMFASSPALSAMEHPNYDLWITGCKQATPAVASPALAPPTAPVPQDKHKAIKPH